MNKRQSNEKKRIEEKRKFFSITAYGIHYWYHKIIEKEIENEFETKSVYIFEYFFDTPFVRNAKPATPQSHFGPFLWRILNEQKFIPKAKELSNWQEVEFCTADFSNIWEFWKFNQFGAASSDIQKYAQVAGGLFDRWLKQGVGTKKTNNDIKYWTKYDPTTGIVDCNFKYPIDYLKKEYLEKIKEYDEVSSIGCLKEYLLVVFPWLRIPDVKKLNIAGISLSTENIFYGVVLIFYPDIGKLKKTRGIFVNQGKESKSIERLKKILTDRYIPILLLYENFWEERTVKVRLEKEEPPSWEKCIFLNNELKDSHNVMEKTFYDLWKQRKLFYDNDLIDNTVSKERLKDTFVFSKYLIASPAMTNELGNIVVPRRNEKDKEKDKDYLPSFLVIGAAGSGKEKMARAIPLFFPEYRFGRRYTINMAALKPDFLSVPLLSGGNAEFVIPGHENRMKPSKLLLQGIFEKIRRQYNDEINGMDDKEKVKVGRENGLLPVVILDELNSLDIDAQGALLRVLENATLQPLGGISDKKVDFLVIGIVNEPEDVLTLQEPLKKFLTEKSVFGGVFGKAFYEYFRGMRRLREDLYFRLVREGKIRIPDLSDRRMDIPILFAFFLVEEELPSEIGWKNLWIDFDVFDVLMKDTISWSGNFRELQSVSKRVAQFALLDPDNQNKLKRGNFNEPFRISYKHIEKVVNEFFPAEEIRL